MLCHFYSSKIRLHLVFLGQALVQHSYHFSVPDLIFSLPPNSIFQQIIPAAREASPEHRQQAAFLCGTRCSSHPPSRRRRRPPPPFPQRGATGNTAVRPPPPRGSCHARPSGNRQNATRGAAAPAASPALQRVSAPLGIPPAAPHSTGGGQTRWRPAHRHSHASCIVVAAPARAAARQQRHPAAPRRAAGSCRPRFPRLCPTLARCHVYDARGMPYPRPLSPSVTPEKGRTPGVCLVPLAGTSPRFRLGRFCRWCQSGRTPLPPFLRRAGRRRPQTRRLSRPSPHPLPGHPPSGSREQRRIHAKGERGEDGQC